MIKIKKARIEDFNQVFGLLGKLDDKNNSKKDWLNLFKNHFNSRIGYHGYILIDNDQIKGFLGLIFSTRRIDNKEVNFCNIGNWIVDPDYRHKSINLLFPVLNIQDHILTNFTASKTVSKILKTLKFEELGHEFFIIPPLLNLSILKRKNFIIKYGKKIKKNLSFDDQRIFTDHSNPNFNIEHILFINNQEYCYLIAKKTYRNNLPFLHIHYLNNIKLFLLFIEYFKIIAPMKFGVVSIILDKSLLQNEKIPYSIIYKLQSPRLFKQNIESPLDKKYFTDHLYSEFIILNI